MHVSGDASTTAYAAVGYVCRVYESKCDRQYRLLAAESKVTPIKNLCVPRFKICAAFSEAQLRSSIVVPVEDEVIPELEIFARTDSTSTSASIKEDPTLSISTE